MEAESKVLPSRVAVLLRRATLASQNPTDVFLPSSTPTTCGFPSSSAKRSRHSIVRRVRPSPSLRLCRSTRTTTLSTTLWIPRSLRGFRRSTICSSDGGRYCPSAVVMRRDVFERCGGFCEEFRAPGYEDPWLWLLAREHGDFRRVHQALVLYRTARQPERIEKYAAGFRVFARLVKQRYGPRGAALVRHFRDSYVSALGYRGLLAMSRGDKRGARHAFLRALNYDPFSARTMLRMARTFMPLRLARAMTGRTRIVGTRAPGV
jgi:hypothetical protein